jgi:hypothetical protein
MPNRSTSGSTKSYKIKVNGSTLLSQIGGSKTGCTFVEEARLEAYLKVSKRMKVWEKVIGVIMVGNTAYVDIDSGHNGIRKMSITLKDVV